MDYFHHQKLSLLRFFLISTCERLNKASDVLKLPQILIQGPAQNFSATNLIYVYHFVLTDILINFWNSRRL